MTGTGVEGLRGGKRPDREMSWEEREMENDGRVLHDVAESRKERTED